MLTIAEAREALGEIAIGKSDEEIAQIRDAFHEFARAIVGVSMGRTKDVPIPAVVRRMPQ